ncbi:AI-2E family transporter [Echinicola shivajiensis]|uniref:AI-2E family transporter n=1 Tax=Echinicola shivajiensis TaxID=1035916 RepID=UPI001BFCCAC9|nr:AI-2E family transporter [Echinicola shivajiensis]
MEKENLNESISLAVEITIRIIFLLLLLAWLLQILSPFFDVILWGIILALALFPAFKSLNGKIGNKPSRTAFFIVLIGVLIIIIPSYFFFDATVHGVKELSEELKSGSLTIPPPREDIADWPLIGADLYQLWTQASQDLEAFISKYNEEIHEYGKVIFEGLKSFGAGIFQIFVATIIAGFLLANPQSEKYGKMFFRKLVGSRGDKFANIIAKTVTNVVKGVLGVAILQTILIGIGLVLAGIPYAGVWTLVVLILSILQLPSLLVVIPAVIWLFSSLSPLVAALWSLYLFAAGLSDNVLKPMLLGKGATVPMIVIFLGVIGGFAVKGFVGLFTGAIIVSLGYTLIMEWIEEDNDSLESDESQVPKSGAS